MHIPQSLYAGPINKRQVKETGQQENMDSNTELLQKMKGVSDYEREIRNTGDGDCRV